jgi:hypothetical protein
MNTLVLFLQVIHREVIIDLGRTWDRRKTQLNYHCHPSIFDGKKTGEDPAEFERLRPTDLNAEVEQQHATRVASAKLLVLEAGGVRWPLAVGGGPLASSSLSAPGIGDRWVGGVG